MSCDLFWIYPIRLEINEEGKTVYDLLGEYKDFLDGTDRFESFDRLCCSKPESARAEAATFSFFKWNGYNMQVEEKPDQGGVDFRAQKGNVEFIIEVKSILRDTFTRHSGVPDNWEPGRGHYMSDIANQIKTKASEAAEQMSGYNCPRILVIACEHHEFSTSLKKSEEVGSGAEVFQTGSQVITLPNLYNTTYLDNSLFIKPKNGRIVFCRKSISAVLLFYISKYHAQATGLLHPNPVHNFSIEFLSSVPFVEVSIPRIEEDSVGYYSINTRWIPDNLPEGVFIYNQWR